MSCPGSRDCSMLCDATTMSHVHHQPGLEQMWAMLCAEEALARNDWKRPSDRGLKKTLRDKEKIFIWSWHCLTRFSIFFPHPGQKRVFSSPVKEWIDTLCSTSAAQLVWLVQCHAEAAYSWHSIWPLGSSEVPPVCTQRVERRLRSALPEVQLVCVCSQGCTM